MASSLGVRYGCVQPERHARVRLSQERGFLRVTQESLMRERALLHPYALNRTDRRLANELARCHWRLIDDDAIGGRLPPATRPRNSIVELELHRESRASHKFEAGPKNLKFEAERSAWAARRHQD